MLIENLRRVADQIAEGKAAREAAHAVWDAGTSLSDEALHALHQQMCARGLERGFLTQMWQRMPESPPEPYRKLAQWTAEHCPNGLALIEESQTAQVAANLTISNIINSLRLIGQLEWIELIEPVSRSLRVLKQLPGFAGDSEGTRQQMTQAMEKIARDAGLPERSVAEAVVQRAQAAARLVEGGALGSGSAQTSPSAESTAAYHLIGPGRAALIAELVQQQGATPTGGKLGSRMAGLVGSQQRRLTVYWLARWHCWLG